MRWLVRHRNTFFLGLFASFVILIVIIHPYVLAQATSANAADGLQVSPALVQLNGEKGKSYTIKLQVLNVTSNDLIFNSSVNDFAAKDETGTPSIMLGNSEPIATSIQTWVPNIPRFSLRAHQTQTIDTVISIPANAEPGGHYGVIRFSGAAPETTGTSVGLSASAGTLILVRVAGNVTEKLNLITFEAQSNGKPGNIFESADNLSFITRFQNTGNVHVAPTGQIEVRDTFGNKVDTITLNSAKGNILPSSTRRFESNLSKNQLLGHYTADISIGYGSTGQAIVQTISFWVIPYKLVIIGLLILITLIFILRTLIKRYNSHIINKAYDNRNGTNAKTNNNKNNKK